MFVVVFLLGFLFVFFILVIWICVNVINFVYYFRRFDVVYFKIIGVWYWIFKWVIKILVLVNVFVLVFIFEFIFKFLYRLRYVFDWNLFVGGIFIGYVNNSLFIIYIVDIFCFEVGLELVDFFVNLLYNYFFCRYEF